MIERKDITEEIKSFRNRMNANDKPLSVLDKDCVRDYAILSAYRFVLNFLSFSHRFLLFFYTICHISPLLSNVLHYIVQIYANV